MISKASQKLLMTLLLFITVEAALISFIDRPLSEYLRGLDQTHHSLINLFRDYTDLGKSKWYLIISGFGIIISATLIRIKTLWDEIKVRLQHLGNFLLFLFCSIAVSGLITDFIKPIIGRARPVELERDGLFSIRPFSFQASWNSFPSGHATTALALASVLILFLPRFRYLWLLFGFLICLSRIMVNAHFISDVCGGALIGYVTAGLLYRKAEYLKITRLQKILFFP